MKIALLGYGKMGRAIEQLALQAGDEIVLRADSATDREVVKGWLPSAGVAIEFSRPKSAFENIRLCLEAGVPVVCGTTAWLGRLEEAKRLCEEKKGALLYASNFSIGVNLFFALNRYLAGLMAGQPQYEVRMEEAHHIQKLDAPSGTAISLAEDILKRIPKLKKWVNQEGGGAGELPILSRREGQVPGTHEVQFHSAVDTITIRHEAHSREGFARGALEAARWIVGKQGYFEMKDMLGF
ncbi:MAG: 4-hydroxy-tetrahydrodipicolinate reductase [Phaeodactylibacter sp.]|nr:4-hydroxy-tetrahydrodipicolinate reductase [Phaeodactylibacter sp.]MCB9287147.1 4-hydroxy-tetrahydrodipicolinate reductase [Lewinellaceae bacterium]